MAARLLPAKLEPGMLVLADRNFFGFKLWQMACASGAKLAWRVKTDRKLIFSVLIMFMLFRPNGLLGRAGITKV